jgi:4-amino-4-deoxy-L-arabinose transferase-like glycosyltransferase
MFRKVPRLAWLVLPAAYFLYFYGLGAIGLLGPDEPRYASIAREMAHSGDWITPRLWGQPWFEKPALLYWMIGGAFRLGLGEDLAPRLPVALLSAAFLAFYWWILRREFGCQQAWFSVLILGTCGAWLGFSEVGVPDLPLTATFSAAMLLALPWLARGDARWLPAAAALLGLAVMAKGLVPIVLAAPLALAGRRWRELIRPRVIVPFVAVAAPWYLLCYLKNGRPFLDTFFWQQQVARLTSPALMHVEPWWYYLPVLAAALLPWTPLAGLLLTRRAYTDPARRFLLAWALFGLVFFSISTNKLPGYVLPLLPAIAALMGLALAEIANARIWIAACALLLVVLLAAGPMLPDAVAEGLSRAPLPAFHWTWLAAAAIAAGAWGLESHKRRLAAVASIAVCVAAAMVWLKRVDAPEIDRAASVRGLWREIEGRSNKVCVDSMSRSWRYGLNYYSVTPLPDCPAQPRPLEIKQAAGRPPYVAPAPAALVAPPSSGVAGSQFRN